MIRTEKVRLYPNAIMKRHIDELCDYRRYCWNTGLALWNDMYDKAHIMDNKALMPTKYKVRNELVRNKADWQYSYSSRCLQLAIDDLGRAWKNFFNKAQPNWGKPKFKSKKAPRQGFKTDCAKIVNGKLRLDKLRGIKKWTNIKMKGAKSLDGELTVVSIYRENNKYWAALPFEVTFNTKPKNNNTTAIDANVGHFDTPQGKISILPQKLKFYYRRIKHYQRQLARKRMVNGKQATKSNNYQATRAKLQRDY